MKSTETSPPTWGKRTDLLGNPLGDRNIPTYVGKTEHQWNNRGVMEKHPHLRGENGDAVDLLRDDLETSPPTWGKLPF